MGYSFEALSRERMSLMLNILNTKLRITITDDVIRRLYTHSEVMSLRIKAENPKEITKNRIFRV